MGTRNLGGEDLSSAEAVLLGALAPGVNGPTWNTLKIAFLMLGLILVAMLGLTFSSSDSALTLHVVVLVLIGGTLFFLLNRIRHLRTLWRMRLELISRNRIDSRAKFMAPRRVLRIRKAFESTSNRHDHY